VTIYLRGWPVWGDREMVARPPVGLADTARYVAVAGIAGVVTGVLVGGLGSRILMRIAGAAGRDLAQGLRTEAGFRVGEVTLAGSIALFIFVGVLFGILGAVLYVIVRPWIEWAGRWRGVVFGIVLFALGSASSDLMNPDNRDFFLLDRDLLNVGLIVSLFLAFGVTMEALHRRFDGRMPRGDDQTAIYAGLSVLGAALGVPLLITMMFTNAGCDCDPSPWVAWFTVVAALGTVAWWLGARDDRWSRLGRSLGRTGLIGATASGLLRAISDAAEILG
jgi:hypothetical protein